MSRSLALCIWLCVIFAILVFAPSSIPASSAEVTPSPVPTVPFLAFAKYEDFQFSFRQDFWDKLKPFGLDDKDFRLAIQEFQQQTNAMPVWPIYWAVELFPGSEVRYGGVWKYPDYRYIVINEFYLREYYRVDTKEYEAAYRNFFRGVIRHELLHAFAGIELDFSKHNLMLQNAQGDPELAKERIGATLYGETAQYGELEESIVQMLTNSEMVALTRVARLSVFLEEYASMTEAEIALLWVQDDGIYEICGRLMHQRYPDKETCNANDLFFWIEYEERYAEAHTNSMWDVDMEEVEEFFRQYELAKRSQ